MPQHIRKPCGLTGGTCQYRTGSLSYVCPSLGVLLFWLMAMLGVSVAGIFFINFRTTPESARLTLFSGGIIPYCDIGISLLVCGSLYLVAQLLTPHELSADRSGKTEEDTA